MLGSATRLARTAARRVLPPSAAQVAKGGVRDAARPVLRRSENARRAAAAARLARAARVLQAASGVFDRPFYELQARRQFADTGAAIRHYLSSGRLLGLSPHPLYEPSRRPRDDAARLRAGYVPFAAFLRRARQSKARGHPLFDAERYLAENPKAARHRYGAWGHFVEHATDGSPLPLPAGIGDVSLAGRSVTWGRWREQAVRSAARWAEQTSVADPPRVSTTYDIDAERRLRAEIAGYPLPPGPDPAVTVILAVRNRPNPVLEAIASVLRQSLGNWELVVVDDGSTDTTPNAVEEVARRDPRVRLVRRPATGVSAARNAGAAQARGRYVAWLDSDNAWAPDFLDVMVRTLEGRGLSAGYAACSIEGLGSIEGSGDDAVTTYRTFAGGLEHLAVGNFVDLNTLVVRRDLLEKAGGFDPGLPRAVDYDLVYRLAQHADLTYVPLLAVRYADDVADAQRISVRELKTWNYVVRDRYTVGWDRVADAVPARVPGRVSMVIALREEWRLAWASVASVLAAADADGSDVDVVLVDGASGRADSALIGGLAALDPRVTVIRTVTNLNTGCGRNVALAHSDGALIAVLAGGVTVTPGWLTSLTSALDDEDVAAAAPVVIGPDGLILSAGLALPPSGALPVPLLGGHPVRDARGLAERGGPIDVPALSIGALLLRARDAVAVRGFDPLYVDGWDDADLSLRLRRETGGRCVVVPSVQVRQLRQPVERLHPIPVQNRRLFASRWRTVEGEGAWQWELADLQLHGYRPRPAASGAAAFPDDVLELDPVLGRPAGAGRRWAVETPEPPGDDAVVDALAASLADALERHGDVAVVRAYGARHRSPAYLDDVVVTIRGAHPVAPLSGCCAALLLIASSRAPLPGEADRFAHVLHDGGDPDEELADRLVALIVP